MKINYTKKPNPLFKNYILNKTAISLAKNKYQLFEIEQLLNIFVYYEILTTIPNPIPEDLLSVWDKTQWGYTKRLLTKLDIKEAIPLNVYLPKLMKLSLTSPQVARNQIIKRTLELLKNSITQVLSKCNINAKMKQISNDVGNRVFVFYTEISEATQEIVKSLKNIKNKILFTFIKDQEKLGYSTNIKEYASYSYVEVYDEEDSLIGYYLVSDLNKMFDDLDALYDYIDKLSVIESKYDKLTYQNGYLYQGTKKIKKVDSVEPHLVANEIENFNLKIQEYNSKLQSYETPLTNKPKEIQIAQYNLVTQNIFFEKTIRPVIVEGPFKGLFLDEMVSSTGKVLGSTDIAPYEIVDIREQKTKYDTKEDILSTSQELVSNSLIDVKAPPRDKQIENMDHHIDMYLGNTKQKEKDALRKISGFDIAKNIDRSKVTMYINGETKANDKAITIISEINGIILNREIDYINGKPNTISNHQFVVPEGRPKGLGIRVFAQQVKSASNLEFKQIKTSAAKGDKYVGYYIWPKMGYNGKIDLPYNTPKAITEWLKKNSKTYDGEKVDILDLYACKVGDSFAGQDFWYIYGNTVSLNFDLTPGSLSMRILNEYLKKKAEEEGMSEEEFLQIDYAIFDNPFHNNKLNINIERFLSSGSSTKNPTKNKQQLSKSILKIISLNDPNGEIYQIFSDSSNLERFEKVLTLVGVLPAVLDVMFNFYKEKYLKQYQTLNIHSQRKKLFNINKIAKEENLVDGILRDLGESDMKILNSIWSDINKLYESHNI